MRFEKWHGIGNDFLLVREEDLLLDERHVFLNHEGRPVLSDDTAIALCSRQFGVGADGVLVLGPSSVADACMRIHNADGSEALMCGNGIRVAARYLAGHGYVQLGSEGDFTIETAGGTMRPAILADGTVRVDMGDIVSEGIDTIHLGELDPTLAGQRLVGHVVNVGNPHFVVACEPDGPDLHRLGPVAEHHPRFPGRSNIEFMAVEHDANGASRVRMRVWERGVGETLACGTGACAAAWSAVHDHGVSSPVTVELPGGELVIELEGSRAFMTGAAHHAYDGEVDLAQVVAGMPSRSPSHAAAPT